MATPISRRVSQNVMSSAKDDAAARAANTGQMVDSPGTPQTAIASSANAPTASANSTDATGRRAVSGIGLLAHGLVQSSDQNGHVGVAASPRDGAGSSPLGWQPPIAAHRSNGTQVQDLRPGPLIRWFVRPHGNG